MIWDTTILRNPHIPTYQWEFQDPKLEVPTLYKAYVREYDLKNDLPSGNLT